MSESEPPRDERVLKAAELVFGLLDPDDVREALRLQAEDPDFAALVGQWRNLAERWLANAEDVTPSEDLFAAVERRLDSDKLPAPAHVGSSIAWKRWAIGSIAASTALAVALALALTARWPSTPNLRAPQFAGNVTQISDPAGVPLLSAVYQRDSATLSLRVAELKSDRRVPELWIIAPGRPPRSLGLLPSNALTINVSPELRELLVEGSSLAITLEPEAGAPHAAPSGKILGTGKLQAL